MASSDDPKELFGLRPSHVGINAASPEEAERIAAQFEQLMGLKRQIQAPISVFADTCVEIMKGNGRGTSGHIGFHVDDVDAAAAWFAERGFEVDETSRQTNDAGETFLIYFKQEIGGFAIHLTRG